MAYLVSQRREVEVRFVHVRCERECCLEKRPGLKTIERVRTSSPELNAGSSHHFDVTLPHLEHTQVVVRLCVVVR